MSQPPVDTVYSSTWSVVRVRYLVLVFLLPFIYLPGLGFIYSRIDPGAPEYVFDLAFILYLQSLWCLAAYINSTLPAEVPFRAMLGGKPARPELIAGLKLTVWTFFASLATSYLLFYPLSYWVPGFVEWWFIETPDIVYLIDGVFPLGANLLSLVSICVIAPLFEEYVFRSLLLHRWAHKYSLKSAIIGSSALFGILHPDPIGAFLFGVAMCLLYLRSGSLLLPIVCHAAHNFVIWLIELGFVVAAPDYVYDLQAFQNELPYGIAAGVIAVAWAVSYFRRPPDVTPWRLPAR